MQFFGGSKLWRIATIRIIGREKFGGFLAVSSGCLAVLAGNVLAILVLLAKFAKKLCYMVYVLMCLTTCRDRQ